MDLCVLCSGRNTSQHNDQLQPAAAGRTRPAGPLPRNPPMPLAAQPSKDLPRAPESLRVHLHPTSGAGASRAQCATWFRLLGPHQVNSARHTPSFRVSFAFFCCSQLGNCGTPHLDTTILIVIVSPRVRYATRPPPVLPHACSLVSHPLHPAAPHAIPHTLPHPFPDHASLPSALPRPLLVPNMTGWRCCPLAPFYRVRPRPKPAPCLRLPPPRAHPHAYMLRPLPSPGHPRRPPPPYPHVPPPPHLPVRSSLLALGRRRLSGELGVHGVHLGGEHGGRVCVNDLCGLGFVC